MANSNQSNLKNPSSFFKKSLFLAILFTLSGMLFLLASEIMVRFLHPETVLYPRWEYSKEYGLVLPRNSRMIHYQPGKWKFVYSINSHGNRGTLVPIATTYEKKNILVLGDSYSMGAGVNDGQEYPAVMGRLLGDHFNVINTGVGGWGLTQQIRRYYEFGRLYQPSLVLLQYCANDPVDNLRDRVTEVMEGRFIFQPTMRRDNHIRQFIRTSRFIQNSQLYRFVIGMYTTLKDQKSARMDASGKTSTHEVSSGQNITLEEQFHIQLLYAFAEDLKRRGVPLWLISVDGALEDYYPAIKRAVMELDRSGLLEFIDVRPWFEKERDYSSPEGHHWGVNAHSIVGKKLSGLVRGRFSPSPEESKTP